MEILNSRKTLNMTQIFPLSILLFTSLGFHNQVYICSKHTAQLVCILMPVKYAPAHTNWVGASTKCNTVDVLHVYRHPLGTAEAQWRLAQYPHSSPLMREGGTRDGDTKRKRENILLSNAAFDFFFFLTLDFTLFPSEISATQLLLNYFHIYLLVTSKNDFRFCIEFKVSCRTDGDALREYFKSEFQRLDIWVTWPMELSP